MKRLRYRDLEALGVIQNRTTLKNWIEKQDFPPGQLTGPNSRTWAEEEVQEWIDCRPTAPKKVKPPARPRGRPRKTESQPTT